MRQVADIACKMDTINFRGDTGAEKRWALGIGRENSALIVAAGA